MRIWSTVLMAVLLPAAGRAQAFQFRSPAPEVTAATAVWQVSSQPIVVQGLVYLPTRDYRLFDGQVMTQMAIYQGVPIYADTTLEVYSLVYVPVGGQRMRTYERKRYGELAGTVGSRTPWYPIQRDVEVSASSGAVGLQTPPIGPLDLPVLPEAVQVQTAAASMVGTFNASGVFTTSPAAPGQPAPPIAAPPVVEAPRAGTHLRSG